MNFKAILFGVLIFWTTTSFAQNKDFGVFAKRCDSLMRIALHENNPRSYLVLMNDLNDKYNKLSQEDKGYFKGYIITAFYNLSCTYSLLNDKKNAIVYLKKAIEAGYFNYDHIQQDSDLDNIRKEEAFLEAIQPLRETGDYLYILKKASKYDFNDKREITKFTYKPMNDPELEIIRKKYNLDSVIGTGNEVSQILNLLHWVHNSFPHDGTKDAPQSSSISNLMDICVKDHKTLDCGSLARVLNDCYSALGFKSRRVVCLPKDSTDFDCHSINTVYSKTMNKWLWIDPTNDAYVMNEAGELLSIEEVRERLVNDKPLILSPEANWNHKFSITKEDYLYHYMAKNLYAILCFVKVGGETYSNLLLPVEYKGIIPRTRDNKPKCTNNPDVFWAKPE